MSTRVLLHAFSTFALGGPQARFVQLANALGSGYEHIVVAMDNRYEAGDRLLPQVRWRPMKHQWAKGGMLTNRGECRRLLRQLRPDLLLSYNWGAIEWAAANLPRMVPQVHVEDGFGPDEALGQLPRRVWTRRALLGLGRVPVVVASRRLEAMACEAWRLAPDSVHYLANGVKLPDREPDLGVKVDHGDRPLCIGTLAGLRPEKNLARMIRAFAAVRARWPARLVLVGEGPQRAKLQALAQSLGVANDVEFTGYLTNPGVRLAEFDLFALSSDTEQLPMALLEAMALGIPTVATRVGDIEAVLAGVAPGNLCEPNDEAFEKALFSAIEQRPRWPDWAEKGRAVVQSRYSEHQMLQSWQNVFDGRLN